MDLRVLCVFVAVAYVDVSARITCIFYPKSWRSAMTDCLNIKGTPIGKSTVLSLTGLHLNGSFWTADYASITETAVSPVECMYRTKGTDKQLSPAKSGNCDEIRNYICGDHNMTSPIVKNGTWQEASKCNETYQVPTQLPAGDYWLRTAFQNYVFTGVRQQNLDRCGMLDVNGTFQFVSNCDTLRYSVCEVGNFTDGDLSVCGSTTITKQPSSNRPSTFVSQKTETFTTAILSINKNTMTESIVRSHASSSSGTPVHQTTETLIETSRSIKENTSKESTVCNQASSSSGTTVQQQTETLTATIMSINKNTMTESIVHTHSSSLSDFKTRRTVQQQTETFTATNMPTNENTSTKSIVRSQASSSSEFNTRTTVQQETETLAATMMSINENTSTDSTVRNHATSSSVSGLGIGLGVSLSIVVIVIVTTVGVCVYKRRYRRKTDNSQVSVRMNALYDDSGQNETPIKPEHTNESYVYAVPSRLRKNDGNRNGVNDNGNEFGDLKANSKAITSTQKDANEVDVESRKDKNTDFAGYSIIIKNKDHHGLRHAHDVHSRKENNTGYAGDSTIIKTDDPAVISNEYDGVDFSDAHDVQSRTENNTGLAGNSTVIKTDDAAVMSNEYDGVDFSDAPDVQSRKENNTGFAEYSTVNKTKDACVISNDYDGVDFSDAPDPMNMNVYSHFGNHDHEDAYDVASCTQTQQPQEGMNDYDGLDMNR